MLEVISLPYGYFQACCHLVCLPSSTCLIDPAVAADRLPAKLAPIRWIIATHGHFDHVSQADSLRQHTAAPLYIHQAEKEYMTQAQLNLSVAMQRSTVLKPAEFYLDDGQVLNLTDGFRLEVIHTPGHTPGGICLLLLEHDRARAFFSGDTLFAGSIGRLDLGGSPRDMATTLARLQALGQRFEGQQIPMYAGHGPVSDLLEEIRENPYFQLNPDELAGL